MLAAEGQQTTATADICELENAVTDTNFVAKVKDFEGQVPTVTGLDLALALSLLTPAELTQYTNGEKLELSLEINKAGALMTDDVITLVTNALKDQEKAKLDGAYYLDITLYWKVGNAAPRKITDLGGKTISIKMDVPEDMYNHIWENKRTYYIVGVHSGVATVHASTTDHTIIVDIGGFSVFALCYADVNVITYPSSAGSGITATTAVTTVSPKTYGEDATERLLLLMGTVSAMIAIAAKVYEFRRRKEEE